MRCLEPAAHLLYLQVKMRFYLKITVLVFILLFSSCIHKDYKGSVLVIGIEGSPTNLDPRYATDAFSEQIAMLSFNGLMRFTNNGRLVPDLARAINIKNNTTIDIILKRNIRFQDGTYFSAADVAATINSIIHGKEYSPYTEAFLHIECISISNPFNLVIHLTEPYAPILSALTLGILPAKYAEDKNITLKNLIGTGPYKLVDYRPAKYVKLEANKYYSNGKPRISTLIFKIIPDDLTRVLELEKGSIGLLVNSVPPDSVKSLMKDKQLKVIVGAGNNYEYVGFNMKDPILKIKKVRQAIAYAINRNDIIRYVLFNLAEPATGILPPWNWAYTSDVDIYPYEPSKAKSLLDQAGYPLNHGHRFTLTYKTSNNPLSVRIAQTIAYELGQIGIKIILMPYEWGTFYNDIRHSNFQMYSLRWVGVMDPDIFYYAFDSKSVPPFGANRGYYINPEMNQLLETARTILKRDKALALYESVQRLAAKDLPYVSLWYMDDITVMNRRLHNFIPRRGGGYDGIEKAYLSD